jgi:hypothetical protein
MTTFALTDPLGAHPVRIHILVQPAPEGGTDRASRPAMVAVGIEGSPPQMLTGTFADIPTLIDTAWRTVPASAVSVVPTSPTTQPQVIAQSTVPASTPSQATPPAEPAQGILDLF